MSIPAMRESHPFLSEEARDRYLARYDAQTESWPLDAEARYVHTECGHTLVRISGPREAAPIVLLPGAWAHSLTWSPAMIGTLSQRYRTYSVDNIVDFGRSACSRPVRSTAEFMTWLDGLFDGLNLPTHINLVGCSRGGWLAAEYALHAPHRLAKVVLLSPGGVVLLSSFKGLRGMPLSMSASAAPSSRTVGALLRWLMADAARESWFDEYVDDTVLGLQCFDRAYVGRLMGPRKFSDDELRGIAVPLLYVAGEDETMYSVPAAVSRIRSVAPNIETAVFPEASHGLITVQPIAVGERVLQFLDA